MKLDTVVVGDCLDVMGGMEENSVDTIITDPPYGLAFMGKDWDHGIPGPHYWREALRVAKPGAFLLAFGGTRTWHRLACAIEDAGWEIRDTLMWLYGSGFPKSHNISKAIDKAAGRIGKSIIELKKQLIVLMDASGKTRKQIDNECGFRATNYLTLPAEGKRHDPWVNVLPSRDKWQTIKHVIGCDGTLDALFDEAEREVIGKSEWSHQMGIPLPNEYDGRRQHLDITAPATEAAAQWDGWGTALKPAHEPIIVAMKPLDGTFAANALEWGVAGLWIDGARVATGEDTSRNNGGCEALSWGGTYGAGPNVAQQRKDAGLPPQGRWPANVILSHLPGCERVGTRRVRGTQADGNEKEPAHRATTENWRFDNHQRTGYADADGTEAIDDWRCVEGCPVKALGEQSGERPSRPGSTTSESRHIDFMLGTRHPPPNSYVAKDDTGTAARFFYQAKASRRERNAGLDDFYWKRDGKQLVRVDRDEWEGLPDRQRAQGNIHPTVKPVALLEYLCKLTRTPTGGMVFDPFLGSGSTAIAAIKTGRPFYGCDTVSDYVDIARARIEAARQEMLQMEMSL